MKFTVSAGIAIVIGSAVLATSGRTAAPQEGTGKKTDDIETLRQEEIKKFGTEALARPLEVEKQAQDLLKLPLDQQSIWRHVQFNKKMSVNGHISTSTATSREVTFHP